MVAVTLGLEIKRLCEHLSQNGRKELIVGDVLDLGPQDLSRLLVQGFLVPMWVDGLQKTRNPVNVAARG